MKDHRDQWVRKREHLVAMIEDQRRQIERNFVSLRKPLQGADRVRQVAQYVKSHRLSIWAGLTLLSLLRKKRSRGGLPAQLVLSLWPLLGRKKIFR